MGSGIYVALSGAVAQSNALDVVASNVANAGTTGYRAERVSFGQALGRARGKDAAFVQVAQTATDPTAGNLTPTGNPLDAAIRGDGYFAVDTLKGTRYTRAGSFVLDRDHRLTTPEGHAVRGTNGKPIVVPADAARVAIADDGSVRADDIAIGQLAVVRFKPSDLSREGASLLSSRGAEVKGGEPPQIVAGTVEAGNFNVVRGVVDLVRISRTYEALHQMISTYRDIDDRTARAGNG